MNLIRNSGYDQDMHFNIRRNFLFQQVPTTSSTKNSLTHTTNTTQRPISTRSQHKDTTCIAYPTASQKGASMLLFHFSGCKINGLS